MRLKLLRNCTWLERNLRANAPISPKRSQPLRSQEIILGSPFQGLLPRPGLGLPLALSRAFGADFLRSTALQGGIQGGERSMTAETRSITHVAWHSYATNFTRKKPTQFAGLLFVDLKNSKRLFITGNSDMPTLHPRLPSLCSFPYPPLQRTRTWRLLPQINFQRSESRSYAKRSSQGRRRAESGDSQIRNDMGLLPGSYP